MNIEKIRKEFEVWAERRGLDLYCSRKDLYEDTETLWAWSAWKASRESLVIELPAENPLGSGPGDHGDGRPSFEQHCAAECNFILRDCRDAIRAAGVKTK